MNKCQEKCNEIKRKIDSISNFNDDKILDLLKDLEASVNAFIWYINKRVVL
jgi:hypothetical protein